MNMPPDQNEYPLMFERPGPVTVLQPFRDLYQRGIRMLHVDGTPSEDIYHLSLRAWVAPGQFDYSAQEEGWKILVEECPEARFCLRLYIASPPWWDEAHPHELLRNAEGRQEHTFLHTTRRTLPSLASPVWRRDAQESLTHFLAWLETSGWAERVWGFFLCYGITWEWGIHGSHDWVDYSEPMLHRFREWLREHYSSADLLQECWGQPGVDFASAAIPSPTERANGDGDLRVFPRDRPAFDFQRCLSDTNVDYLLGLAQTVRSQSGNRYRLGTFYGFTVTAREHNDFVAQVGAGGLQGGHHALARVQSAGLLDFIGSPYAYANRNLGEGLLTQHYPLRSVQASGLHGYEENDLWTFTNPPIGPRQNSIGATTTRDQSILHQRLALAQSLCHGTSYWWTDLTDRRPAGQEVTNYRDAGLLHELENHCRVFGELPPASQVKSVAQIALILDEVAIDALSLGSKLFLNDCYNQLPAWAWCGAPFDIWLASDVTAERMKNYKLAYVFAPYLSAARRDELRGALCHSGRTVWWAPYTASLTEQGLDVAAFKRLTSFDEIEPPSVLERREGDNWISLYGACAGLSAQDLAGLAGQAGVHLYGTPPVQVMAGEGRVAFHCREAGEYEIRWRDDKPRREVFTGALASGFTSTVALARNDVALFITD